MSALQVLASQLSAGRDLLGRSDQIGGSGRSNQSYIVTGHGIRGGPTKAFNPAAGKVSSGSAANAANDGQARPSARAPNATPKDHTPTGPSAPDKNENSSALSRDPPGEMESCLWNTVQPDLEGIDSMKDFLFSLTKHDQTRKHPITKRDVCLRFGKQSVLAIELHTMKRSSATGDPWGCLAWTLSINCSLSSALLMLPPWPKSFASPFC
eukprot:s305_g15.t1